MEELEEELDSYHYHEVVDRIHCVRVMLEELLTDHPAVVQTPEVQTLLENASRELSEAYQKMAIESELQFPTSLNLQETSYR